MTDENREKWADLVRLFLPDEDAPHVLGPGYYDGFPEIYGVEDLPKTETELAMIGEALAGLGSYRRTMLGDDDPLVLSSGRVHVLSEQEFRCKIAPKRFQGKTNLGHVYLYRGWKPVDFHAILIHELVHATSYLWVDLHDDGAEAMPGEKWRPVTIRRNGLTLIDPSFGTWLPHFHGLNEGVTETVALIVRGMVAKTTKVHGDDEKKRLSTWMSSLPLVQFVDRLIREAVGGSDDSVSLWRALTRDMVTGTDVFLSKLEARLPGATEILRRTGATPPELKVACESLGFDDLVDFMDKYG